MHLTPSTWAQKVKPSPTLEIKSIADALRREGKQVYDFGIGEMNPEIPVPHILKVAIAEAIMGDATHYSPAAGDPDLIDASRRRRIARGSGSDTQDVSGLVKTFKQTRQMMKTMSGMNMTGRMKAMKQMMQPEALSTMLDGKGLGSKVRQRSKRKRVERRKRNKRRR